MVWILFSRGDEGGGTELSIKIYKTPFGMHGWNIVTHTSKKFAGFVLTIYLLKVAPLIILFQRTDINVAAGLHMCPWNTWRDIVTFKKKYFYTELKNNVSTGDGRYMLIFAINGEILGPSIVVYQDQIVS